MSAVKLQIDRVSKVFPQGKFGAVEVLHDLSLEVSSGEFLCLVGPSGCGKTTILKIVAGLEAATGGRICLDGRIVREPGPERGLVFQDFALFPWRNVTGNVAFGPEVLKIPRQERLAQADEFIGLVGLRGSEHKYPAQLSGGMKQRVAIARALANNPEVLLMDEPFGSLDAQTRYLMQQELLRIWNSDRKAIIFVTHSVEEAVYLAERVVVMTACPGKIKEVLTVDLPYPRNRADQDFISLRERIMNSIIEEVSPA